MRTNIAGQELRASYFASRQEFFETYIDVLMQMHKQNPAAAFDATALAVSERARARSLLELLKESRADIRQASIGCWSANAPCSNGSMRRPRRKHAY